MNAKRKNGNVFNKTSWIRNTFLGRITNIYLAFSTNSNGSDNIAFYLYDENTRKTVEAANLEAKLWRVEVNKLRLSIS